MSAEPHWMPEPGTVHDDDVRSNWLKHVALFLVTLLCVFHVGARADAVARGFDANGWFVHGFFDPKFLWHGASFALPLLAILLAHEFGHFFAARWHRVPASLPYFIPLPFVGWGTLGAVISMRGVIRTRNALLDIGASGPLAGLIVALPVLAWGLAHSDVMPMLATGYQQEGQSLLYLLMKRVILGPIPHGSDVVLHPTALAGWVGLLITMLNLLPWGQLDGGHIAYALFGARQHRYARWFRRGLFVLFAGNLVRFGGPVLLGHSHLGLDLAIFNSIFWLTWALVLGLLARFSGGPEHPPCEPSTLSPARRVVACACLALFAALFMPTPMAFY